MRADDLTTSGRQTFCLYCQKDFGTPGSLAFHIREKHPGTYADRDVVIEVRLNRKPQREHD